MNVGDSYNPKGLFTGIFIPETMAKIPNENLSSGAKLCFGRLCWHVNENGECFPSRETLAGEIGVSESSVRDYLKQLEDQGFIRRIRNGPHANDYEFSWTDVLEASVKRKDRQRAVDQKKLQTDSGLSKDRQSAVFSGPSINSVLREELREEENTPPTPSEQPPENLPCTFADFTRMWNRTRGLKHLGPGDRKMAGEMWTFDGIWFSILSNALSRFAEWFPTAKSTRSRPVEIFLRDPFSWARYRTVEKDPEQPNVTGRMASPVSAVTLHWKSDTIYGEYLFALADRGKRITEPEAEKAFLVWCGLTEEQKRKTIEDAKYIVSITEDPKYIPRPTKHLGERPWNAIRREVKVLGKGAISNQRAREILDRMNPSGSEGRVPLR